MTQIKFADGSTLGAVLVSGAARYWQGASRDVLSFQFGESDVTFEQLQAAFSAENCASLVIGDALYEHYTLRVSLSLKPVTVQAATADAPETVETRWVVEMAQQTYTERQMDALEDRIAALEQGGGDTIATADLDAAYREGVNSYE